MQCKQGYTELNLDQNHFMQCKQGYPELEIVTITRQFSDTSTCD